MLDRSSFEKVRIWAYMQAGVNRPPLPKIIRKLFAKSPLHRAWLQGHSGSFLLAILERSAK